MIRTLLRSAMLLSIPLQLILAPAPVAAHGKELEAVFLQTGVEKLSDAEVRALESILAKRPDNLRVLRNVGMIYMFRARAGIDFDRHIDAAIDLFERGLALDGGDPWLHACYGISCGLKADHSWSPITMVRFVRTSMKELDRAVEIAPDFLEIRQMRAMVLREIPSLIGKPEVARQDLEFIIGSAESGKAYLDEQSITQSYLALADICFEENDRARAADLLHQVLLVAPDSPEGKVASHLLVDWKLERPDTQRRFPQSNWNCAVNRAALFSPLEKGLGAEPENSAILTDLAATHICGGLGTPADAEAALRLMEKAKGLAPDDPFVRGVHGAMMAFWTKFAWYPVVRLAWVNLGIEEMTSAIDSVPPEDEVLLACIRRHRGMAGATVPETVFGQSAIATADLDFVLSVVRKHPSLFSPQETAELYLKRGELHMMAGETARGRKALNEIFSVSPESCQASMARELLDRLP